MTKADTSGLHILPGDDDLLTVAQAGNEVGLSTRSIGWLLENGYLEWIELEGDILIRFGDLMDAPEGEIPLWRSLLTDYESTGLTRLCQRLLSRADPLELAV